MKRTFIAIAFVLALVTAGLVAQQPAPTRYQSFGGFPTLVASNMTTNVTCGGVPFFRDRGIAIISVHKTVTNEATAMTLSFEFSTNRPGDSATNWFRPRIPVTVVFTNHSGILTNSQVVTIAPSTIDNMTMIRPFSWANAATTNNWTNVLVGATTIP